MAKAKPKKPQFIPCSIPILTTVLAEKAAKLAIEINPANAPMMQRTFVGPGALTFTPQRLALLTSKWWGKKAANLPTAFMDNPSAELRRMILQYMNAWSQFGDVKFVESVTDALIRISRGPGGYYSYLGTDCASIPRNEQTLNLEAFTVKTPLAEYDRVVVHEAGHALGFIHEHMRPELVSRLNVQKTRDYFWRTQRWRPREVDQQVLTPIDERMLTATPSADEDSIMCYQLPGSITKDGKPIRGGDRINALDAEHMAKVYPKPTTPPPPPPPPPGEDGKGEITFGTKKYKLVATAA